MNCGEDDSPSYVTYGYGVASSPSSSSSSVFSNADDASSQSSLDSDSYDCSTSTIGPSFVPAKHIYEKSAAPAPCWPKLSVDIPAEQRQHPRRSSSAACPPALVRQCERKVTFVDSLVDSSAQIVEAIWPLSSVACRSERNAVLPLRTFIQETLRRSRTSYSTLQVALYYLILIKPHVPAHDFTMEQPADAHSIRALQCGRRMFLAALILASKYLQDRNYSARAWSKISGLNTAEINQNEMAFLLAVNWRIHITDAVFQRWTDIVLQYTPQPPSPGSPDPRNADQSAAWKSIILKLNPELDNVETPMVSSPLNLKSMNASCPRNFVSPVIERSPLGCGSNESTPTPKYITPTTLEPLPTFVNTKLAPALGLLPTPRLTPQSCGFNTPAVSAASYMLNSKNSMGFAMSQSSSACATQLNDRWQTASPQSYVSYRRSSLANSVSSMSSPESMVSDSSSRSSRSSSISSASGMMSAPAPKLDVQARCRYAKLCSERNNRTAIASVPESYCDNGPTSSPDSYSTPVGKEFYDLSIGTPDIYAKERDAVHALAEMYSAESPSRGSKRSRPLSMDHSLHENVREILGGTGAWGDDLVRPRAAVASVASPGRKRVCCSTEAIQLPKPGHPAFGGIGGPGMWSGILN